MAKEIIGVGDRTVGELRKEVLIGGKFVYYYYTISFIIYSMRRSSNIFYIPPGEKGKALKYNIISGLFGWWGIPHGIIWTIGSFGVNGKGGKDITSDIMTYISHQEDHERPKFLPEKLQKFEEIPKEG